LHRELFIGALNFFFIGGVFFIKKGFPETKLVSLKIFDYLIDSKPSDSNANAKFERSISIAGNLDIKKSA